MEEKGMGTVARELMSWETFDRCVAELADKIRKSGKKYESIYGIPRGGLVTAVALSHKLNIPITLELNGKHEKQEVLIVDDVVDTGKTALEVNTKKFDTAALCVKPWRKYKPEYWTLETAAWVVFPWEEE